MNYRSLMLLGVVFAWLALAMSEFQHSKAAKDSNSVRDIKDEAQRSEMAAQVFQEIMDTPGKGIPKDLFDSARCVAVFPNVLKTGFVVGGSGGLGVASCRTPRGWSSPAYFNLDRGSFGLQIGAQSTDFVLLFMDDGGMNSLLSDQFTLGSDASVAAGPVGHQAKASTDAKSQPQILSYTRRKGLFAGLELKGVVIKTDKEDIHAVYGGSVTCKEVLNRSSVTTPAPVAAYPKILNRFS